MQQELTNFYQFLYHVTPVVIIQVENWLFCHVEKTAWLEK